MIIPYEVGVSSLWKERCVDDDGFDFDKYSYEIGIKVNDIDKKIQTFKVKGEVSPSGSPIFNYLSLSVLIEHKLDEIIDIHSIPEIFEGEFHPKVIYWQKE